MNREFQTKETIYSVQDLVKCFDDGNNYLLFIILIIIQVKLEPIEFKFQYIYFMHSFINLKWYLKFNLLLVDVIRNYRQRCIKENIQLFIVVMRGLKRAQTKDYKMKLKG